MTRLWSCTKTKWGYMVDVVVTIDGDTSTLRVRVPFIDTVPDLPGAVRHVIADMTVRLDSLTQRGDA